MSPLKHLTPQPLQQLVRRVKDQFYFQRKIGSAVPVLVYQMGKVGSSSIYRSLCRQYPGVVAHAHYLSSAHYRPLVRSLYDHALVQNRPLKVITLTREPIGRNISAFFQNFEDITGLRYAKAAYSIEELKDIFLEKYSHEDPLYWFDINLLEHFGIDVYACRFPEQGVCLYQRNNIEVLLLRLETPDDEKVAAVRQFLQLDHFNLNNINLGREKDYSRGYQEFKRSVTFPRSYLDSMYGSRYFQHFYDEAIRDSLTDRWSERISKAA